MRAAAVVVAIAACGHPASVPDRLPPPPPIAKPPIDAPPPAKAELALRGTVTVVRYTPPGQSSLVVGRPLVLELVHCGAKDISGPDRKPSYTVSCASAAPTATAWHRGPLRDWLIATFSAQEIAAPRATTDAVTAALRAHRVPLIDGDRVLVVEVATQHDVTSYRTVCGDARAKDLLRSPEELDEGMACPNPARQKQRLVYAGRDAYVTYHGTPLAPELPASSLPVVLGMLGSQRTEHRVPLVDARAYAPAIDLAEAGDLRAARAQLAHGPDPDRDVELARLYDLAVVDAALADPAAFAASHAALVAALPAQLPAVLADALAAAAPALDPVASGAVTLALPAGLDAYVQP